MSEDAPFAPLEVELESLIAAVAPQKRAGLAVRMGRALRRAQAVRIAAQQDPEGNAFAPRKPRETAQRGADGQLLRNRRGRIKRRAAAGRMFRKLRLARWLTFQTSASGLAVGFASPAAARIARVHQLGLRDRVSRDPGAPETTYPERRLLGLPQSDIDMLLGMAAEAIFSG